MRVLTLNIWNLSGDWRARRLAILAVVGDCAPDVVCLQEVVENERGNQAAWLAAELGWEMAYAGTPHERTAGRFGNAVVSRHPITAQAQRELPYVPDDLDIRRVVLHARTAGVDVFCTHLAWQLHDAGLRERQVVELVRFMGEQADPDAPLGPVLAGDFNAEPDATAIRYLCGLATLDGASMYLQDAWRLAGDGGPGHTWSNANPHAALDAEPDRRLDYVFSGFHGRSGRGRPLECRVVADTPVDGVWPTDHYGVLAVLQD
ncbi:MAG TPA: endonuclease/exonuclease/phosphatase family protein [Acidimicrobiales bacterium]